MANRWPPWIEATAGVSGLQTVNSTSNADVAGMSLEVTPKIATRVLARAHVQLQPGTIPCRMEFQITATGLAVPGPGLTAPQENAHSTSDILTLSFGCTYDLVAASTYTIKVIARITTAGDSFSIYKLRSSLSIVAMPSEGIAY